MRISNKLVWRINSISVFLVKALTVTFITNLVVLRLLVVFVLWRGLSELASKVRLLLTSWVGVERLFLILHALVRFVIVCDRIFLLDCHRFFVDRIGAFTVFNKVVVFLNVVSPKVQRVPPNVDFFNFDN